jgi:tRNA threonylcarbamoyladenosine biosynthesis protein TsaE
MLDFGKKMAASLRAGLTIYLFGNLGAGKTTLTRGILHGLGYQHVVKSPTYNLVEIYKISRLYLYHFDFYRFEDVAEWDDAGVADCFRDDALCLVEWPERVAGRLPDPDVAITLAHASVGATGRTLTATATTRDGERCIDALAGATLQTR